MSLLIEILASLLLLIGGLFAFAAGFGVLRLPDLYVRMHASTKAGTLGAMLVMAAVALFFLDGGVAMRALVIVIFLLLTAPVAAHLIGRAAYRSGVPLWERSVVDEYAGTEDSKPDRLIGAAAPSGSGAAAQVATGAEPAPQQGQQPPSTVG